MIALDLQAKSYGAVPVLGALSLRLAPGEALAISGPSGSGKTTLLRLLAGLDRDFQGTLERPERVAMVFQEPTLLPWRAALDNVRIATGCDAARARSVLGEVGLGDLAARFPRQLSLGQQRRLSLARALAADPELLLLDEPFVSLEPRLAEEMLDLTTAILARHGIAAVLVTHAPQEATRLAARRLVLEGSPATLRKAGQ